MSYKFKIVLLGEGRVGKTSLILRYVNNEFNDKQISTIQASFLEKRINFGTKSAYLAIWDTAGQERFHALGPIYYRDSDGAILVYDITDRESFTRVQHWVKELKKIVGDDITLLLVANKCDLERKMQVTWETAEAYAQTVNAKLCRTSAKSGLGVDESFLEITKMLIGDQDRRRPARSSHNTGRRKKAFVDLDESVNDDQKSSCC
eukprot:4653_1